MGHPKPMHCLSLAYTAEPRARGQAQKKHLFTMKLNLTTRTSTCPKGYCSRRELACYYFPHDTPKVAVDRLRYHITHDTQLQTELLKAGYLPGIRYFSPRILRVLANSFE